MSELERQKKIINMMITAHSILRDKYARLSSFFEITLLITSFILATLVFVDANYITRITSISEDKQKLIIGLSTIIVFAISIVLLQVDWKEKAENHSFTANQLFMLLQECRGIVSLPDSEEKNILIQEFNKKYSQISFILAKIPDRKFNSLKLAHYRKVELSKLIDKHPSSHILVLKVKLFISSFKEKEN